MKNFIKILYFCTIISPISCQPKEMIYEDAICIQNIDIVDPEDGLKENQTAVMKQGKIHKIANSDSLLLSIENQVIEGKGTYLLPGLWDAHLHFAYIEEIVPYMFDMKIYD